MKKILLLLTSLLAVFAITGCAEEDEVTPIPEKTYEEKIRLVSVHDVTKNEAILMTAQSLYNVHKLSDNVSKRIMHLYKMLETGDFAGSSAGKATETGKGEGIGKITSPAVASTVLQVMYARVLEKDGTNTCGADNKQKCNLENLKAFITYSSMDDTKAYDKARKALLKNKDEIGLVQDFIKDYKTLIVPAEEKIVTVAKEYEKLLLDSSSSASKTAGGGGAVNVKQYAVSANVTYTFVELLLRSGVLVNFDLKAENNKITFVSELFYGLTDETKLKLTYDKDLSKFNLKNAIPNIGRPEAAVLIKSLISDINDTKQIPGGQPFPASYVMKKENGVVPPVKIQDSELKPLPYLDNSADRKIITSLGDYLLASPTGKNYYVGYDYSPLKQTNNITNNMAVIYAKLKEFGLKSPATTSEIGAKTLSEIIAKHIREVGISYLVANTGKIIPQAAAKIGNEKLLKEVYAGEVMNDVEIFAEGDNQQPTPDQLISGMVLKLFLPDQNNGNKIPACMLIEEYNKALDAAEIAYAANKGYFSAKAKDSYCGLYIDGSLRKDFLTPGN